MKPYKHILLAVELNPATDKSVIDTALKFAKECDADLTLVHAVEYFSGYGVDFTSAVDVLTKDANKLMQELGEKLHVPAERRIVKRLPAKQAILDEAKKCSADLIVLGSHGRHGINVLLGSTANAVLHGAKCDVLAVRLKE